MTNSENRQVLADVVSKRSRKHTKLKPVKNGRRECYVTLLHDVENKVDLVIGAGTKAACIEAFKRISPGTPIDSKKIYHAVWRKAKKS